MAGTQDIGIGFGLLYMTNVAGNQIVATQPNTVSGVRNMRQQGTSTAPLVVSRPAVGTITVTSTAGLGSITAINIYGINQIGAAVDVLGTDTSLLAGQIANAINGWTATVNFTAQAIGNVVFVFSPIVPQPGYTNYNGASITVSTTQPSIVTTTTPTTNGSTQFGDSYDEVFGYRFWLNADYGPSGVPGTQPASTNSIAFAIEVSDYFNVRGLQSGIVTLNAVVDNDRIINLKRKCAITQVIVDTEGGAATDTLAFIQTEGFSEGDEIQLRSLDNSRLTTVEDLNTSTSSIATKNILLIDSVPFDLDGILSITLQLRSNPFTGFVWVETGRSQVANGIITKTLSEINNDILTNQIVENALYIITDLGAEGTYTRGLSSNRIDPKAVYTRRVPIDYDDTWRTNLSAPVIGNRYRYFNEVYESLTGILGAQPPSLPNWQLEPASTSPYYSIEQHDVILNIVQGVGIDPAWPIIQESDSNNNVVMMTYSAFQTFFDINAFDSFPWVKSGINTVRNNTVKDAVFEAYQFTRPNDLITNNTIEYSLFRSNNPNPLAQATIDNLNINSLTYWLLNVIEFCSYVTVNSGTISNNNNLSIQRANMIGIASSVTITNNTNCLISDLYSYGFVFRRNTGTSMLSVFAQIGVEDNTDTTIENVYGFTGNIAFNNNVLISGLSSGTAGANTVTFPNINNENLIRDNTNITIYSAFLNNGYIQNCNNTVPANKSECVIAQVTITNESAIDAIVWNTIGAIARGTITNKAKIINVVIDLTENFFIGDIDGRSTVAQQMLDDKLLFHSFNIDGVSIDGDGLSNVFYGLDPSFAPISAIGETVGFTINTASNNAYVFLDADVHIVGSTFTVPIWAQHAGIWYFCNCNGQNIDTIIFASGVLSRLYRGPRRIVRFTGLGSLTITPTPFTLSIDNQITSSGAAVVMDNICDVVELIQQGTRYTITDSIVVL